jgi:ribose transport system ATP-binding protein
VTVHGNLGEVVETSPHTARLELVNVSKTFPGTRALTNVSLEVDPGEVHAIVGQNGSGKSTMIKILAGYHAPDPGGRIYVQGTLIEADPAAAARRLGLRFVHQGLGLINELNAVDNFSLAAGYDRGRVGRIRWRAQAERLERSLARFGVELDIWRPVGECNEVERTAVAIARALDGIGETTGGALVLDEPTVALTAVEVGRLFGMIREIRAGGVSVVYVSHYLNEIFEVADRVSVLRGGHLVGTDKVSSTTHGEIVEKMIGKELAAFSRPASSGAAVDDGAQPILSVSDLSASELRGVSFELRAGEILGIAGLQGSGIDELPYALVGASRSHSSEIRVDGHRLRRLSPSEMGRAGVRLIPRDRPSQSAILPFSVRENMTLAHLRALRHHGRIRRGPELAFVRHWMSHLDVQPRDPERTFATLSGGNQQKVVLGKWLGVAPRVLVLHEPTNGVDIGARAKIYATLRERADAGLAVVLCSSDADELAQLSTRVLVLVRGRVAQVLRGDDITESSIVHGMASADE